MFSKREETDRLLEAAGQVLARYGPGDVIPHGEIAEAIGHEPGEHRYYALAMRARRRHCDVHGIWSREVNGVGFRMLTPQEQITEEQHSRRKRARRQIGIGSSVAAATPDASLTEHERRIKQHAIESHARLRKELTAEERHEKWLLKPPTDKPITVRPPRIANATGTE